MTSGTIRVEVFTSPACRRCGVVVEMLRRITSGAGGGPIEWRAVDVITELDYAVALGVRATPAIAIDGKLVMVASPTEKALRQIIARHLTGAHGKQKG